MKLIGTLVKILTALAAVVGAVYVLATYGDKIVAWAKQLFAKLNCCGCCQDAECCCEDCDCEDCDCECECAEESEAVEAEAEAPAAEEVAAEEAVVADETDFA